MAIVKSGQSVGAGVVTNTLSVDNLYVKAATGTAIIEVDGYQIAIDDAVGYQAICIGNKSFEVVSGSIDYFMESY
jgi:hypothetical protein